MVGLSQSSCRSGLACRHLSYSTGISWLKGVFLEIESRDQGGLCQFCFYLFSMGEMFPILPPANLPLLSLLVLHGLVIVIYYLTYSYHLNPFLWIV